nr:MAG: polyprotein [Iflaviridae sp.]
MYMCYSLFSLLSLLSLLTVISVIIVDYCIKVIMNSVKNVKCVPTDYDAVRGGVRSMGKSRALFSTPRSNTHASDSNFIETPYVRLTKFFNPKTHTLVKDTCYASAFNSWVTVYNMAHFAETFRCFKGSDVDPPLVSCKLRGNFSTPYGVLDVGSMAVNINKKLARDDAYKQLLIKYVQLIPCTQMDTEQGDVVQTSDQQSNTIITNDSSQAKSEEKGVDPISLPIICSTEPMHEFESVMNRWMALDGLEIKSTMRQGDMVQTYNLPSFLYKANTSPNLMPFENFVYGTYNIEFKFVVNANKFHVGKVLCNVKYDSYQMEERRNSLVDGLCRPHIILDLSTNNEGVLAVPFKYHRTFVRNASNIVTQFGTQHAQYASVYVQILSPLGAIPDAAQAMYIRPFFRIKRAQLTGMSHKVALTQGDSLDLEGLLKCVGTIANLDRPTDLQRQTQVIPKSRLHFCAGKAPIDSVPMRMDPSTLTTYLGDHKFPEDPTDMMQIARIWGLAFAFTWNTSHNEGETLVSQVVDPTYHCPQSYTGTPTPLEYVCSMYQFWTGPIELRFDFVSNAFHTGSIMISAEFGRSSSNLTESSSTYTKTFHLGDQKSCTFTIPYIYDTPYRRTSCTPWVPLANPNNLEMDYTRKGQTALYPKVTARFKVRVINKLVPIQSTTQSIQVLCFWRGGAQFSCHSPIMANLVNNEVAGKLDNFPGMYPLTQMDDGTKEDLDPTDDFNQGVKRNHVMSIDNHTNIKDLLRRPIHIVGRTKISAYYNPNADETANVFYIPCMPPSRMCGLIAPNAGDNGTVNQMYSKGLQFSYHSHILDLFRFWRGSQRFTILVDSEKPVYVSYVPHSGARLVGEQQFNRVNMIGEDKSLSTTDPSAMGLPVEIIIPNINPSVIVEAPYELENNFALMQEKYSEDNYSWRDKSSTNTGHLIVWSHNDFHVDVWWAAGDDFEVSNFYGIPPCRSYTYPFFMDDNHPTPKTQMDEDCEDPQDFQIRESLENTSDLSYWGRCKGYIKHMRRPVTIAAASQIPVIGPTIATTMAVHTIGNTVEQATRTMAQIENATEGVKELTTSLTHATNHASVLLENSNATISKLAEILSMRNIQDSASSIYQIVAEKVSTLVDTASHVYNVVVNTVIDILINLVDFNVTTLALSVLRFIANIANITFVNIASHVTPLVEYFKKFFTATTQGDIATEQLSASFWGEDMLKQGLGLFVGIIGTAIGVSYDKRETDPWLGSLCRRLTTSGGMNFLNGSMRFVETIFLMIKEAVFALIRYSSIENKAIMALRDKSKLIDSFVKESQLMTHEANIANIHNPEFKIRFWTNVVNAYEIQKMLANIPTNKVAPILAKTCNDVIKLGRERMADLRSSPVRYEPYVICIHGATKIGKSFATTPLATELLQAVGYKCSSNNPIYYRIQGSKFWNDYVDQPCVVIDEWMNLSDSQSVIEGVRELFQLKSPAVFIPEQAAIEEKKIRANPKLVIILTNTPFPDHLLNSVASDPAAVYRRRDILIKASLKPQSSGVDLHSMSLEDKIAIKHLNFNVYEDPTRVNSLSEDTFDFAGILNKLKNDFCEYNIKESENVRIRMSQLQKFWQVKTINTTDPFSLFYEGTMHTSTTSTSGTLPSELLDIEVARLAQAIDSMELEPLVTPEVTAQGSIMIYGAFAAIGVMGVRALANHIRKYEAPVPAAGITCCVCDQSVTLYACCSQSYNQYARTKNAECLHIICQTCSVMNTALNYGGCPLCRDTSFMKVYPTQAIESVKCLWRMKKMGVDIMEHLKCLSPNVLMTIATTVEAILACDGNGNHEPIIIAGWGAIVGQMVLYAFTATVVRSGLNTMNRMLEETISAQDQAELREYIELHIQGMQCTSNRASEDDVRLYRDHWIMPYKWDGTRNEGALQLQCLPPGHPKTVSALSVGDIDDFERLGYRITRPPPQNQRRGRMTVHQVADFILGRMQAGQGNVVQPQIDDDQTSTSINHRRLFRPRTQQIDNMHYELNMLLYSKEWANPTESTVMVGNAEAHTCFHEGLEDDIATSTWEDGAFMVPTTIAYRRVEWKCCKGFCLLNSMNKRDLCQSYFDHHKLAMYNYITNHYHTPEFKEQHKQRMPSFMFPTWLDMQSFSIRDEEVTFLSKLNIHPMLISILKAIGVAISAFVAFKGLKAVSDLLFKSPTTQLISSGDAVIRKFKPEIKKVTHGLIRSQGDCGDAIMGKVVSNYFVLRITNPATGSLVQCVGLGIKQRIGLLPRHYHSALRKAALAGHKITLGPALAIDHGLEYSFDETDFLISEVSDLAIFYLPISYNMFKDITRYFGTDADLTGKYSPLAQMVRVPTKTEKYVSVVELQLRGYKKTQTIIGADGAFTSLDCLEYNYSQAGACGSVVMIHNHTRPIRGIHIAGVGKEYGGTGYAALVTQEDLNLLSESANTVHAQGVEEPDFLTENIKMHLPLESIVSYKGAVSKSLIPYASDKSAIKPSLIAEELPWKTTKAPAILSARDPRYTHPISPLVAGCAKHGYLTKDFSTSQLQEIAEIRRDKLLQHEPLIVQPKRLTIEEAVIGIPEIPHYEGIKMSTSAGWPYCTTNKTTKDHWTVLERNDQDQPIHCQVHDTVLKEVQRKEKLRKEGIVPMTLFVDTLKDEKKTIQKVTKLGGTRVFCSSPYDFTIAMRQNFLHFVAMYYQNRDRLSHSVGISMTGREVTQLVTDLLSVGNNIVTLDYSNFGPGFNATVAGTLKQTVCEWLKTHVSDVDPIELECLVEENINSHHIMGSTVYQQRGGSPSGSPITVVINSEVNISYIMLAWLNLVETGELSRWAEFDKNVVLRVYGDDLIMSVSNKYIGLFNGETIMQFFKTYGIVATDATKSADIIKFTGILEASYLKHTFAPHPTRKGQWIAALDMESIRDTPMWIQEAVQLGDATRLNAEAAIRNAYGHGPEAFKQFKDAINAALRKVRIAPILITWQELDDNFFNV